MKAGVYIHVPFCLSKCPYCDFYSLPLPEDRAIDAYVDRLIDAMAPFAGTKADTLYFGGGTPSLLGGERIARLIQTVRQLFSLPADAEITLEANPADHLKDIFSAFTAAGGNRLSLGMQSSDPAHLTVLGRRHTPAQLERAVRDARAAGIQNLSLDMMLATPGQTKEDVRRDVSTCVSLGAQHVSAYLLKIEPGTPFFTRQKQLDLPDEDRAAELYLTAVDELSRAGFEQYEISNFARPGCQSRHNLKYWTGADYYGFGPAASSYFDRKRRQYPRDLAAFLNGGGMQPEEETDPPAGSEQEYALLRLRLTAGLSAADFQERFGHPIPVEWQKRAAALPPQLVRVQKEGIAFTPDGFLLSNTLISRIIT